MTGGLNEKTVEKYSVKNDRWCRGPDLSIERMCHASCCLNGTVYLFCGVSSVLAEIDTIEKLSGAATLTPESEWEQIVMPVSILGKQWPIVAPLNSKEILIMGGTSLDIADPANKARVTIYNLRLQTSRTVLTAQHEISSICNQSASQVPNEVVALVRFASDDPVLVKYSKFTN